MGCGSSAPKASDEEFVKTSDKKLVYSSDEELDEMSYEELAKERKRNKNRERNRERRARKRNQKSTNVDAGLDVNADARNDVDTGDTGTHVNSDARDDVDADNQALVVYDKTHSNTASENADGDNSQALVVTNAGGGNSQDLVVSNAGGGYSQALVRKETKKSNTPCRYYERLGVCPYREKCLFNHIEKDWSGALVCAKDLEELQSLISPCKFLLFRGKCNKKAGECFHSHKFKIPDEMSKSLLYVESKDSKTLEAFQNGIAFEKIILKEFREPYVPLKKVYYMKTSHPINTLTPQDMADLHESFLEKYNVDLSDYQKKDKLTVIDNFTIKILVDDMYSVLVFESLILIGSIELQISNKRTLLVMIPLRKICYGICKDEYCKKVHYNHRSAPFTRLNRICLHGKNCKDPVCPRDHALCYETIREKISGEKYIKCRGKCGTNFCATKCVQDYMYFDPIWRVFHGCLGKRNKILLLDGDANDEGDYEDCKDDEDCKDE